MNIINIRRLSALILALILIFTLLISYAESAGNDIANSVLRLHILANSNSDTDQQLKLEVRNRILNETKNIFQNAQTPADAKRLAQENAALIKQIAEDEIRIQGFDYPVSVSVEEAAFPTKTYGDVALPSGKYEAVRIKIGNAQGKNWWCVMYPPLCFTDGILSASAEAKSYLANRLTADEYSIITGKSCGAIPVEVRFKIVEIFQNIF